MNILSSIIHLESKEDRQLLYDAVIYAIEHMWEYEINSAYIDKIKVKQKLDEYTKIAKVMQEKFPDILH